MNCQIIGSTLAMFAVAVCVACSNSSGRPARDSADVPPDQIVNFDVLYGQNGAGCHGVEGSGGAAMSLANPTFLAMADDSIIRRTASNGVPGTPMPSFAQSAGGMLTDRQIDALVRGIRSWAKSDVLPDTTFPPYAAQTPGDPQRGADVYRTYCSSCHGIDGRGGRKASSIVDGSYLALVSDQQLRTIVIAGRPELGAPDWRTDLEDRPMSPQEITDVVAWLSVQRPQFPVHPHANSSAGRE